MHRYEASSSRSAVKGARDSHRAGESLRATGHSSRSDAARRAFGDEDFDEEEDDLRYNGGTANGARDGLRSRDEVLVAYSRSGAETKHKRDTGNAAPLVISKQEDADWMEERKRRLGLDRHRQELGSLTGLGGGRGRMQNGQEISTRDRIGDDVQHVGLQLRQRRTQDDGDTEMGDVAGTPALSQAGRSPTPPHALALSNDEDASARAALLSGSSLADVRASTHAIIAPASPLSEEKALQRDVDTRPDAPTVDVYTKMPVEEFGAALLRGMGWREGMGAGRQRQGPTSAPDVKKRAALLGLGAKERPLASRDDDSSRSGSRSRSARPLTAATRPERRYVPVVRREHGSNGRDDDLESGPPHSERLPHRHRSRSPSSRFERGRPAYDDDEERRRSRRRDDDDDADGRRRRRREEGEQERRQERRQERSYEPRDRGRDRSKR